MSTARVEGANIVLVIPIAEAQALRVALSPCQCKHPKSNSTKEIRERFAKGIGMAVAQSEIEKGIRK